MGDATTFDALAEHAAAYFYGALKATEDFDSFERTVGSETRRLARASMAACVERFDSELAAELPASWRLKGKPSKTVLTVLGPVTYRRSLYVDRDGLARYPADELLGIPKGQRMSADAFVWIARRCAVVSYRRAAADFAEMSGHRVSAMRCWRVVQREAELIRAELASAPPGEISQPDVYAECDGLHVALQSPERRKEAISRFLYEQSRKKSSVEMKVGCVYAGVREERGRRRVRGNVALFATCGSAEDFRAGMRATVEADYAAGDIETIHFASDGGPWCTDHGLDGLAENIDQGLDMFHVLKKTVRAFPEGAGRERMFSLAV